MPTTPPTLTAPPGTPPSSSDPANFDTRADALVAWFSTLISDMTAALANVFSNATDAANSASSASASASTATAQAVAASNSASNAAASAGATAWVSGNSYTTGQRVYSPTNGQLYRRLTTSSAGTTDPGSSTGDTTNWERVYVAPEMVTAESLFFASL